MTDRDQRLTFVILWTFTLFNCRGWRPLMAAPRRPLRSRKHATHHVTLANFGEPSHAPEPRHAPAARHAVIAMANICGMRNRCTKLTAATPPKAIGKAQVTSRS